MDIHTHVIRMATMLRIADIIRIRTAGIRLIAITDIGAAGVIRITIGGDIIAIHTIGITVTMAGTDMGIVVVTTATVAATAVVTIAPEMAATVIGADMVAATAVGTRAAWAVSTGVAVAAVSMAEAAATVGAVIANFDSRRRGAINGVSAAPLAPSAPAAQPGSVIPR